jgi:hypothetical protein
LKINKRGEEERKTKERKRKKERKEGGDCSLGFVAFLRVGDRRKQNRISFQLLTPQSLHFHGNTNCCHWDSELMKLLTSLLLICCS